MLCLLPAQSLMFVKSGMDILTLPELLLYCSGARATLGCGEEINRTKLTSESKYENLSISRMRKLKLMSPAKAYEEAHVTPGTRLLKPSGRSDPDDSASESWNYGQCKHVSLL